MPIGYRGGGGELKLMCPSWTVRWASFSELFTLDKGIWFGNTALNYINCKVWLLGEYFKAALSRQSPNLPLEAHQGKDSLCPSILPFSVFHALPDYPAPGPLFFFRRCSLR